MLAEEATLFEKRPDFQVQINDSRVENDDIDKKIYKQFLIYEEIQERSGAK